MALYSIKELEQLSGIKAHTIRIWEQRYQILAPSRTDTNIRFYDDEDLKWLLNISLLNEKGTKISKIAKMTKEEVAQMVQHLCEQSSEFDHHINGLITAMLDLDEALFDKVLSTATLQLGFQNMMQDVVYPFLKKIGILWQTGNISPAHEHFISNLIRQKILVAIDGQVVRRRDGHPTYMLFLPEGEMHEIALLYMNYLLRTLQIYTLYLGQSLPFEDLKLCYKSFKADYICTVLTSTPERSEVQAYIDTLSATFPEATIMVYGSQVQHDFLVFPANVTHLTSMQDFVSEITATAKHSQVAR
ncbi:MerR family transcriptional regulator [Pontibacter qinzhouensis]|uniref:MerR family transcriptional regulator n=1 Tax=Pontibacter qinzhouensis TaxID=2603253 RepID=A0A5C8K5X8_9BACT|nr:MerR family transcriptional regulator [Pontibacter qinzhouensis]TXK44456.1 MerR family transcriptional regulator [Pontibacter qinzhouensis]